MVQVIWTKRAVADLDSIGKYIAIDSEYAAQKFVQELIKKAETLINYPRKDAPFQKRLPKIKTDTSQELSHYL